MTTFKFTQSVGPENWHPLPRHFEAGETLQKFTGNDHGVVNDDLIYGGFETVACTIDGSTFFTEPGGGTMTFITYPSSLLIAFRHWLLR